MYAYQQINDKSDSIDINNLNRHHGNILESLIW